MFPTWLIYLTCVFSQLNEIALLFVVFGLPASIGGSILFISLCSNNALPHDSLNIFHDLLKKLWIFTIIFTIILILTPDEEQMILILANSIATPENINNTINIIKDLILTVKGD